MTPIKQTKFYNKELNTRGNCLTACIASLFDMNIEDVPFFIEEPDYPYNVEHFIENNGYKLEGTGILSKIKEEYKDFNGIDGYYIAVGMGNRGVYHCCIYKDGEMVHDPHPSNDGIQSIEYIYLITRNENDRS